MSVYCSPIQLQKFNFVITYNLIFLYLFKSFVVDIHKPLKLKLYDNHGHILRLTQESAKIPQAGRTALIFSDFRLRKDNVGYKGDTHLFKP